MTTIIPEEIEERRAKPRVGWIFLYALVPDQLQLEPEEAFDPAVFGAFPAHQSDLGTKWTPRYLRSCASPSGPESQASAGTGPRRMFPSASPESTMHEREASPCLFFPRP
jgi:hypothetical protein